MALKRVRKDDIVKTENSWKFKTSRKIDKMMKKMARKENIWTVFS